jgi:hypothetical protein
MDWTIISDSLLLTSEWQLIDLTEFNLVKLTTLGRPEYTNTISVSGRFEIAQFDSDNSCINLRAIRWESFSLLLELPKPDYFEKNKLGIRLAPDFAPFLLKVEGKTVSITSSKGSVGNKVKVGTFVAMSADATPIIAVAANEKRRGIIVTNTHTSNYILGYDNTVSAAPGKHFAIIPPGETYESNVTYTGVIWQTTEAGKNVNQPYIEIEAG